MNGKVVAEFEVSLTIQINEWDDGTFDWWASNGADSSELFESAEAAASDARRRFE